jgi:hypothetical protein
MRTFFKNYIAGFLILFAPTLISLVASCVANDWSGYNPLYYLMHVVVFFVLYLMVCLTCLLLITKINRQIKNIGFFIAGFISGLPLLLLIRQTSYLFVGFEVIFIIAVSICIPVALLINTQKL